jgi:hypothetical protein
MANLTIKTAEEFMELDSLERQASRRAARQTPLVQLILQMFVDRDGPIPVPDIVAAGAASPDEAIADALRALDDDDVIRVRDGHVDIAYPFSASPTAFVVCLPSGQERYACCATDALGIAPMLGQPVGIRSRCHHCGTPLELAATPHGPAPGADDVMLWVGRRGDEPCKAADSL